MEVTQRAVLVDFGGVVQYTEVSEAAVSDHPFVDRTYLVVYES